MPYHNGEGANGVQNERTPTMTHDSARRQGLEPVYPEGHQYGDRVFWDAREGRHYDAYTDCYLGNRFDPVQMNIQAGD